MMSNDGITIRETSVDAIRPLRHEILRAGLPPEASVFDGDDEPTSRHISALDSQGRIVGCASIVQRPFDAKPAWQLRGMATAQHLRRAKVGARLIAFLEQLVRTTGGSTLLWCNARTPAVAFYQAMGWTRIGEEFIIPTAGPHFRMMKQL